MQFRSVQTGSEHPRFLQPAPRHFDALFQALLRPARLISVLHAQVTAIVRFSENRHEALEVEVALADRQSADKQAPPMKTAPKHRTKITNGLM